MLVRVPTIGETGLITDYAKSGVPGNALTVADNVRCRDGKIEAVYGDKTLSESAYILDGEGGIDDGSGTLITSGGVNEVDFQPHFVLHNGDALNGFWLMAGLQKCFVSSRGEGAWQEITRASGDYNGTADDQWSGDVLNGILAITNGVDTPQAWTAADATTDLVDLPNWDTNDVCGSLRAHRNFLIALNVTKSSIPKPHMVKWSNQADPGTSPTWDETDATSDAGEFDLPGADHIIDGGTLRDFFVIYKERSTHIMQYIGGQYIFRFTQAFSNSGILGKHCWTEVDGRHVVLTGADLIIHDGNSSQSVLDNRARQWLFSQIDADNASRSFLVKHWSYDEVWVCFPESGEELCTRALVWNWKDNTITTRRLANVAHGSAGPTAVSDNLLWSDDGESWDSDPNPWSSENITPTLQNIVMAAPTDRRIILADASVSESSDAVQTLVERVGLTFDIPNKRKFVRGVRPRFSGDVGEVTIQLGGHESLGGAITWGPEMTFAIGTDFKTDHLTNGRYIAFRMTSETGAAWALESLDFDLDVLGDY